MSFDVVFLGVGDSFSERYSPTSLLLRQGDFQLAVDCPDGYRRVLAEARAKAGLQLDLADIDDVLLTHVHGDHMNGLEGVAFFKRFAQGRKLRLHASAEVHDVVWPQRLVGSMGVLFDGVRPVPLGYEDYFEPHTLPWGAPTRVGPFTVTTRRTRHHVPTSALLVAGEGGVLGYSADAAFDPDLVAFLDRADVIIHETNLGPAHTDLGALLALPERVKAKLRLVHYPDAFDVDGCALRCAREGDVLTVTSPK
ncbi:MAG: MBL fold metallo-hydrolase [Deltaproteobacteria bacterium]|nr:MBL fold metallo-hydrolase [Deltaproteobacteria bacterium]